VNFSSQKNLTAAVGSEPAILGDTIPGPSSPYSVAIPNELPDPRSEVGVGK
jgi:hypothetical protein